MAELLVVTALLGVLLLTAFPQLIVPGQIPAGLAARGVAADLGLARRLAIAGRANYVVTFSPVAGPYTSYTVSLQGGTPGPDFPKTIQKGVTVTGTPQVITFTPTGPAAPSGTLTFPDGAAPAQGSG